MSVRTDSELCFSVFEGDEMSKLVNEKEFARLMLKMPDELAMWQLTDAFMRIQATEIQILTKEELTLVNPKHKIRRKKG